MYFGGGTPSLLPIELIRKIVNKFKLSTNCEITFEMNPDDITKEFLEGLKDIGINRLSIGAQTFDDTILKSIGRRHNAESVINGVKLAQEIGFNNISLDLIYGLPNQTIESLEKDLLKYIELNIQHISTYGLKIEDNSFWGKNRPENLPNDDIQAEMYEFINNFFNIRGFPRYEISNFAIKGYESRHNLVYWNNQEYYGFGVSAHGYVNGVRYSNFCTLEDYIRAPHIHEYGNFLTEQERLEEEIFLGFRKTEGIDVDKINNLYKINFNKKYKQVLEKYVDFIEKTEVGYKLNLQGVLISNLILSEFLE